VAIKAITIDNPDDPDTREMLIRFGRGARAAGMLGHPNIVSVYDYAETEDTAYLVMEFVEGLTLKALLEATPRLPMPRIAKIMEEVLAGLAFSHSQGIVHRDIKPANILIANTGQAKITDFGIARIERSDLTQAGTVMGSPAYMSPEQFRGDAVDHRTDIYSAGVILFQMLTGKRPYEGSLATIMHKALHDDTPVPSSMTGDTPQAFDLVVRRAMAKRAADRYPSARDFADAIKAAINVPAARRETAPPPRPVAAAPLRAEERWRMERVPPATAPGRERNTALFAVAAGAALCVVAAGVWLQPWRTSESARTAALLAQPAPSPAPVPTAPSLAQALPPGPAPAPAEAQAPATPSAPAVPQDLPPPAATAGPDTPSPQQVLPAQPVAPAPLPPLHKPVPSDNTAARVPPISRPDRARVVDGHRPLQEQAEAMTGPGLFQTPTNLDTELPRDGTLGRLPDAAPFAAGQFPAGRQDHWTAMVNPRIGLVYQETEAGAGPGSRPALQVTGVVVGLPAYQAGIRVGDLIVAVSGQPVSDPTVLVRLAGTNGGTQTIPVELSRGGRVKRVLLSVGGASR
jgi:serine/threonine-protein kinase